MSLVCPSPPHLSDVILPILDYFMFLESVSNHKVFRLLSPLPGELFPESFLWLVLSHLSKLSSKITSSKMLTLNSNKSNK